ncbi:phage gp6-like head-tail connector protein [Rhizobium sp. WW_1]|jgi:hypothetical protein|uniref:phage gp6-like head-tail connector protein n=1 Tax=Rhizobium sp. WW_1 TaxID=1907375 RepID=UPI0006461B09|nr:phage gp6-like head-tail connector protein [Rhizobium sp. WW_1]RKD61550.1 hypothetical protein BJ928_107151 [Rhizobium sp. WW_1]
MWYPPVTVGDKPASAIAFDVAKRQCRELPENTEFDDDIKRIVAAAQDHAERYCGQFFSPRTVKMECDSFDDFRRLDVAPVRNVVTVSYVDTAGAEQTLPQSLYMSRLFGLEASIFLRTGRVWPQIQPDSRITVTADIGYDELPDSVAHAMLLWIAAAFINPDNQPAGGETAFDDLMVNHRRYG